MFMTSEVVAAIKRADPNARDWNEPGEPIVVVASRILPCFCFTYRS
jgi:hypothetical protein